MAFDNSPTQNRIIVIVALTTGLSLFSLKFVFDSYFVHVMEEEAHDKMLPNTEVTALRAESDKRLASGTLPLAQAKKALEERGRAAFPEIQPKASDDTRALIGWSKLPKPANDVPATTATGVVSPGVVTPATSSSTSLPPAHSTVPPHTVPPHTGTPTGSAVHAGAQH